MEVYNQNKFSKAHFDSALSSSHLSYILADDDAHNISDIYSVGRCCTLVNTVINKDSILKALKNGETIGADIYMHDNESNETKREIIKQLPVVTEVKVHDDTLSVKLNSIANSFTFIGQGGVVKKTVSNFSEANYVIQKSDTYIRTEIVCADGTVYYLNPVFRYDGIHIPYYFNAEDKFKTFLWRTVGVGSLLLIYFLYRKRFKDPRGVKSIYTTDNIVKEIKEKSVNEL